MEHWIHLFLAETARLQSDGLFWRNLSLQRACNLLLEATALAQLASDLVDELRDYLDLPFGSLSRLVEEFKKHTFLRVVLSEKCLLDLDEGRGVSQNALLELGQDLFALLGGVDEAVVFVPMEVRIKALLCNRFHGKF